MKEKEKILLISGNILMFQVYVDTSDPDPTAQLNTRSKLSLSLKLEENPFEMFQQCDKYPLRSQQPDPFRIQ